MINKSAPELMGLQEVAQAAGVTSQAVANWVQRRDDFPRPIATLASGSIWDGAEIRRWLKEERHPGISPKRPPAAFVRGHVYTLHQITNALGGETQSYLPQREGRIVCGRFTSDMNIGLPYEVLVGNLPRVRRKAELLASQTEPIPVFIKQGPDRWRFYGRMRCAGFATERATVRERERESGRTDLAGVLRLVDAE